MMNLDSPTNLVALIDDNGVGRLIREWRRVRAMTQHQLAAATQVSARHLSFVENGRARPSRKLIHRVIGTLKIPERKANEMLAAAGFSPTTRPSAYTIDAIAPVSRALDFLLASHQPYPAFAMDRL